MPTKCIASNYDIKVKLISRPLKDLRFNVSNVDNKVLSAHRIYKLENAMVLMQLILVSEIYNFNKLYR